MGRKVHLINESGHKIEVESSALAEDEQLEKSKYSDYDIDVDWYLANGYMTVEDMIKFIETGIGQ